MGTSTYQPIPILTCQINLMTFFCALLFSTVTCTTCMLCVWMRLERCEDVCTSSEGYLVVSVSSVCLHVDEPDASKYFTELPGNSFLYILPAFGVCSMWGCCRWIELLWCGRAADNMDSSLCSLENCLWRAKKDGKQVSCEQCSLVGHLKGHLFYGNYYFIGKCKIS